MIDVEGGTPEDTWRRGWTQWTPPLMDWGVAGHVVVVAPHPDDEVLACGGTLYLLGRLGHDLEVVAVTDGEASHPRSTVVTPGALASRRRTEAERARALLGLEHVHVAHLGLPDGELATHRDVLVRSLAGRCTPSTIVLAPRPDDGHPDHEACGRAATRACQATGARLLAFPVWLWNWATPGDDRVAWGRARRTDLPTEAARAKTAAVAAFETQVTALGDGPHDGPVLPPAILAHHRRAFEVVFL